MNDLRRHVKKVMAAGGILCALFSTAAISQDSVSITIHKDGKISLLPDFKIVESRLPDNRIVFKANPNGYGLKDNTVSCWRIWGFLWLNRTTESRQKAAREKLADIYNDDIERVIVTASINNQANIADSQISSIIRDHFLNIAAQKTAESIERSSSLCLNNTQSREPF